MQTVTLECQACKHIYKVTFKGHDGEPTPNCPKCNGFPTWLDDGCSQVEPETARYITCKTLRQERDEAVAELAKWKGCCKSDGDCDTFEDCIVCEHRDCHNRVMVYNVNMLIEERDKARKLEQLFRGAILNLKWSGEYPNRICPFCGYNESKSMAHGKDCPYWMAEHL